MTAKDDNTLQSTIDMVRRAYWDREKWHPIWPILETMELLFPENKKGEKIMMLKKQLKRTPQGWHLVFALPANLSSADIMKHLDHFQERAEAIIELRTMGKWLHMNVITAELPARVPYLWTPADYRKMTVPIPIGAIPGGILVVDLARLPHMLVGGNTGGGKTTFLIILVISLITTGNAFPVVIDLKGLDFQDTADHALMVDTEAGAHEVLTALNRELDRRKRILQGYRVKKLQDYPGSDLPWIMTVIDELGELQDKESQKALNRLVRLARAVGISVVAATQRPSHTLFSKFTDTRMLFAGRICFHVPAPEDSRMVLNNDLACKISPNLPGRAVWQWEKQSMVQCMYLSDEESRALLAGIPHRMEGGVRSELRPERLLPR